jgi:PKD repeat protein
MKKSGDSGNLSIDFLVGFTIFIIAFIWVVSMIPGLLINLQGFTIDYDAVAYRTGVILAEDPGVVRFGLAISKDTPHILSEDKVNQFFCTSVFTYPEDYQERVIFGDYPYRFNISLIEVNGSNYPSRYVGDILSGSYGSIRRLVKIKGTSNATINYSYMNTELLKGKVTNPIYQINPALEKFSINITDLNKTMYADRESCFNVSLDKIYIYVVDEKITPLHHYYDPIINGTQYRDITSDALYDTALPKDIKNISLVFYPKTVTWSDYSHVYINLTFDLVKTNLACACPTCPGSQFLNNTPGIPFEYNYHPDNVTQPNLRDATLEVSVGSGYRTATEMLIKPLKADFTYAITSGTTVQFLDKSTGSPVDWAWAFEGSNTSTQSNPTHTFPTNGPGHYTVFLTVTDAAGKSDTTSKTFDLLAPVAGFTPSLPVSGPAPLMVVFTDTSANGPMSSYKWEFNDTPTTWSTFSTSKPASKNFPAGVYNIRLTVTNTIGSNTTTKLAHITALPLPVANFTANPVTGVKPLTVTFIDSTTNSPILWNWSFGEGNYSVIQNPVHIYESPGTYTVSLNATNIAGSNTLTRNGIIIVTAVPTSHTITVTEGSDGWINPNKTVTYGTVTVSHGASQSFTITPNTGYHITNVIVNDTYSQGAVTTYTFNNVVADQKISATFAANTPQTLYYNNFERAANLTEWTLSSTTYVTRYSGAACRNPLSYLRNCTASAQLSNKAWMQKTIPTTGYTNIVLSFEMGVDSLAGIQNIRANWSPNGLPPWTTLSTITHGDTAGGDNGHLNYYSYTLPATADNKPNFALQFILSSDTGTSDYGYVDDVRVIGTHV